MSTISIKNVGPLTDTGTLKLTPVTLLIGKQSTGKSTLMKILCFCQWVEKHAVMNGNGFVYNYSHYYKFRKELMKFHHFSSDYFSAESEIVYISEHVQIRLVGMGNARITLDRTTVESRSNYKVCFIPAERNLLSALKDIEKVYRTTDFDMLFNHILEWNEARGSFSEKKPLPLVIAHDMAYYYDEKNDRDVVVLTDKNKRISPYYASSGVQSALPIAVMSRYLCNVINTMAKNSPTDILNTLQDFLSNEALERISEEGRIRLKRQLTYRSFSLFIEELEQNLFPNSQFELLCFVISQVKAAGKKTDRQSMLFLTSHSPYILTALNVLMLGAKAYAKDADATRKKMNEDYILKIEDFSAYCINRAGTVDSLLDEETGLIKGDYLDAVSDTVDDYTYAFNEILYGRND